MRKPRPPGARGPTGVAPPPPTWLARRKLPITVLRSGTVLHRIHRASLDPVFFGPGPGVPPTYRFDSATGRFGVLYVGTSRAGAVAETLLRNPQRLTVSMSDITVRAASELTSSRALRVVRLHGSGLQRLGTDNSISTGPYEPCGLWSDALWEHPDKPDGIAYQSRHNSAELCLALFERPATALHVTTTRSLTTMLAEVAAMLNAHGKSISPG